MVQLENKFVLCLMYYAFLQYLACLDPPEGTLRLPLQRTNVWELVSKMMIQLASKSPLFFSAFCVT